jgi:glycosyltransferase involved in cell wall biosynthesis
MFEMAAFNVPSVCQNMLPYSEVVKHGFNGLLADTETDWVNHISTLVEHADLRRVLGDEAFRDVSSKWSLTENCRLWEKAYLSLLEPANASSPGRDSLSRSPRCGAGS